MEKTTALLQREQSPEDLAQQTLFSQREQLIEDLEHQTELLCQAGLTMRHLTGLTDEGEPVFRDDSGDAWIVATVVTCEETKAEETALVALIEPAIIQDIGSTALL
jgi:hypothetical protein